LGISKNTVINILERWHENGFQITCDNRSENGSNPKLSPAHIAQIVSPAFLNRQASMSLKERISDIR